MCPLDIKIRDNEVGLLDEIYEPIEDELKIVEQKLKSPESVESLVFFLGLESAKGKKLCLEEMERYIIEAGGKRLRAGIVLLSAMLCGTPAQRAVPLAVAIELFHTASLVIDDMMVDADVRRSKPTLHRKWEESGALATALGLQLRSLPSFFESLRNASDPAGLLSLMGQTFTKVLWGAFLQHRSRTNYELTEEDYLEIIEHKTSALFEACSEGGAVIAGVPVKLRKTMRKYGHHLGRAFQITDDVLDYTGDPKKTGKGVGSDIAEGRPTLPFIHFWRKATEDDKNLMLTLVPPKRKSPLRLSKILKLFNKYGSIEYCMKKASEDSAKAVKALSIFERVPARMSLEDIALLASHRSR